MKTQETSAEQIWKQIEDLVVPCLGLSVIDRAVYSYLVRHSHLEGRSLVHISIAWLARGTRLSATPTRKAVRRLVAHGALRLVHRSKAGHVVGVRLPMEIPRCRKRVAETEQGRSESFDIEQADFLRSRPLRRCIHARERGVCFYCQRRLTPSMKCIDHAIPSAANGRSSYRNLVSCCLECNSRKGESRADDFLRSLYRDRRLTALELSARLSALDALAAGKLRPILPLAANPIPRKGRPTLDPTLRTLAGK
jgi:5-methylcytosine-specific restriction endonuclease McrA